MNHSRTPEPSTGGISLGDIYFVLFRHKWKILLLTLTGFAAAAGMYFFKPPPFQSQAELLIKYVPETTQLSLAGDNQKVLIPDSRGDDIINSEIKILTSLDLAEEVVTNLGASNILAQVGGGANPIRAAILVHNNVDAAPADKGSSVIVVTFKHRNPQIVQPVLQELINDYFQRHYEIHSAGGQFEDALAMEQSALKVQLSSTEQQLADLKNKANIVSLDDSRKQLSDQIAKIRNNILDAQAELSGYEAAMKKLGTVPSEKPQVTNAPAAAPIPSDQLDAYNSLCASLDALRKREQNYQMQGFTRSNTLMQELEAQIAAAEKSKGDFEQKFPQIASHAAVSPSSGASTSTASLADVQAQIAQVAALQAKIKAWDEQLTALEMQATNLNNLAPTISQLEQTKAIQEANYQNLSVGLERAHIDQALDTGKSPNIKWVQMPTPPFRDWKKTYKFMGILAFGGLALGVLWAFLIEWYLDRSVKRPIEIETKLKLPLFLAIPDVSRNGHARRLELLAPARRQLAAQNPSAESKDQSQSSSGPVPAANGSLDVVSLEKNPALQPFYDALRDRLVVYFEVKNLTHKPKLVAVTGAGPGAGASTIAAGLAAALSETKDGNVLLVDMNLENGAAQQFYKGKPYCGLDAALNQDSKNDALVQEGLYVVNGTAASNELPLALPKRFATLVPKLKASDFDYIIFDMPPVAQTSITARLSRFMDMTLLVVESEKTDRDVVLHANQWLVQAGATVSVVLNKTHKYVPARLHQEFLADQ